MAKKHADDTAETDNDLPAPSDGAASDTHKLKATKRIQAVTTPESAADEHPPQPDYPRYRIDPGEQLRLVPSDQLSGGKIIELDPDETEHYQHKKDVRKEIKRQRKRITDLQARLYAENKQSLLIVLQAIDTGGKDGTIKHVFRGVNPQGCRVWSFKVPSTEEMAHDFLWRYHQHAPQRGMITIFNRSHYEDVLVVRVKNLVPEEVWRQRYEMINEWEHMLTLNNTAIIKFFLYISKDEQKERLESRLEKPDKHWKFSKTDLKERAFWNDYMEAYQDAINKCSTEYAPWYAVPANHKWYRNLVIARTIADTLEVMNPQFPPAEEGLDKVVVE